MHSIARQKTDFSDQQNPVAAGISVSNVILNFSRSLVCKILCYNGQPTDRQDISTVVIVIFPHDAMHSAV